MSRGRRVNRSSSGTNWGRCLLGGASLGVAAFLISAVLLAFGFFTYAKHFLQGDRFHQIVEAKLSNALKAEVDLGQVKWEGASAFADRVNGQGREDAGFAQFGLAGLRADLDLSMEQFRRRVWKITELTISQLDVRFSEDGRLAPASAPPPGEEVAAAGDSKPNLLAEFVPRELELDRVKLSTLNLFWESPGSRVGATGMQTVIEPRGEEGGYAAQVRGGMIQGTKVPKLDIDELQLLWKDREIFVTEAKLRSPEGALLDLEGEIALGSKEKPGSMRLNANVTQLSLSKLAQGRAQPRVQGDLEISTRIEGDPEDLKNARQDGRITLRNGVVETIPVLVMLARFTGSKRFERIALRDGGGAKFVREKGKTVFSEIDFQSDGLGRLTGDLVVEDGNLSGVLQLGVIPGTLSWIPTAEQKIFTDSRDGHLWTPVRVSGTVDHPEHDLTTRLASAGVEAAVDVLGKLLEGGQNQTDSSGNAPPTGAERLGNAIDLGRELLKGFLR